MAFETDGTASETLQFANTTLWDNSTGRITVFFWASPIDRTLGNNSGLIAKRDSGWGFLTLHDNGGQRSWLYKSNTARVNTATSAADTWQDNVWNSGAMRADGSDVNNMANGANLNSVGYDGTVLDGTSVIQICLQAGDEYHGRICELAFWDDDISVVMVAALNRGVCPFAMRNDILLFYCPVHRLDVDMQDYISRLVPSKTAGISDSNEHAPVELIENYL